MNVVCYPESQRDDNASVTLGSRLAATYVASTINHSANVTRIVNAVPTSVFFGRRHVDLMSFG